MRPVKLSMQAFGSYGKRTDIDFNEPRQNIFLISGDTGAGKSTIFDAIAFALFGEASSEVNKKDGTELQSQFSEPSTEPFTELSFTEWCGGERLLYTVRRVPRHLRPLKKGIGLREEKETVSLLMPDGTEFSSNKKETDKRIQEIIGLTKQQFMQLSMIAQGEFMEVLRARSDEKKLIFRKLFDTEIYQRLTDELMNRRRDKLSGMSEIHTACVTEISHILIPEEYEAAERLEELKKKIVYSERINIADMEQLLTELSEVADWYREQLSIAEKEYKEGALRRDKARDAITRSEAVMKSYMQLQEAESVLSECEIRAEEMRSLEALIPDLRKAYEIRQSFFNLTEADRLLKELKDGIERESSALPGLERELFSAAERERSLFDELKNARGELAGARERADRALEAFRRRRELGEKLTKTEKELDIFKAQAERAKEELNGFMSRVKSLEAERDGLEGCELSLEKCKQRYNELKRLEGDYRNIKNKSAALIKEREEYGSLKARYVKKGEAFKKANESFLRAQEAFFDRQAGILAREKLRDRQPCPVCGSINHPAPAVLPEEHKGLSREYIDRLSAKVLSLRNEREEYAKEAGAKAELVRAAAEQLDMEREQLFNAALKYLPNISSCSELEAGLSDEMRALLNKGQELKKAVNRISELRGFLAESDRETEKRRHGLDEAKDRAVKAERRAAELRVEIETVREGVEFDSEASARESIISANRAAENVEKSYSREKAAYETKSSEKERAEERLRQYRTALPEREAESKRKREDYERLLLELSISETEWRKLCESYKREDIERLELKLKDYRERRLSAEAMARASRESIGDEPRQDISELKSVLQNEEAILYELGERVRYIKGGLGNAELVENSLGPRLKEREEALREFTAIESLYSRLAGKLSGARMDIETYAQRYYMKQILHAANKRFLDMSAGQFELRMTGEEQAGEGKNRGLDLMVYSHVTGKEREVRTLSGGESFMAALALALGMGDRIQQRSAGIHLEMMFIDEGFGSLDEHSRAQAVRVLKRMAGGSRLIGIISHVTELKQEIEDRLQVTKDADGSHVRWQLS